MAAGSVRSGTAGTPTTTTAGTPGTSARVVTFDKYVRPCLITNKNGANILYVKINAATASATVFDLMIKASDTDAVDLSQGGRVGVKSASFYAGAGDYADVIVVGWTD